jgi:hypothetical protein
MFAPFFSSYSTQNVSDVYIGADSIQDNSYFLGPATSTISGNSGSGNFHVQALFRVDLLSASVGPSALGVIVSNLLFSPSASGWQMTLNESNQVQFFAYNTLGAGTFTAGAAGAVTPGQVVHACGVHNGTEIKLYINGEAVTSSSINSYSYTNFIGSTARFRVGRRVDSGQSGNGNISFFGAAGGNFVPTDEEIRQAYRDSIAQADIVHIPGKTQHLWSVKRDCGQGKQTVTLVDKIGSVNLTKTGNPTLTTSPFKNNSPNSFIRAINNINDSNYYGLSSLSESFSRGTSGSGNFFTSMMFQIDTRSVSAADRYLTHFGITGSSGTGYSLVLTGTNAALEFRVHDNNAVVRTAPKYTFSTTETNKVLHVVAVYDNITEAPTSKLRLYLNGIEQGTATSISTGYRSPNNGHAIGRYSEVPNFSLSGSVKIYGYMDGNNVPTAAEILENYNNSVDAMELQPIPGKTDHLLSSMYDLDEGIPTGVYFVFDKITGLERVTQFGSPTYYIDYSLNEEKIR